MKRLPFASLLAFCFLSFTAAAVFAQAGTIKGKVTDAQTHETLPGATVVVEGTAHGAAADVSGNYTITDVPAGRYQLVARFIGYQDKTIVVNVVDGQTTTQNFELAPSGYTTNPVVITAIGSRQSRVSMGTAVSTVQGKSLVLSGAHDVLSALTAKAPGIYVTPSSGDPGSATRIVLRGPRSLQNDNQPLIVIDGEPVFSGTIGLNNVENGVGSSIGQTNGISNVGGTSAMSVLDLINPNDIASMEVYEGPSAAAIWGSRAANGVIVISTRGGAFTPGNKVNISLRDNIEVDNTLRAFPLQTQFGEGLQGAWATDIPAPYTVYGYYFSWGDKISLRSGASDVRSYNYAYAPITQKNSKTVYNHATELFHPAVSNDYGATISGGDQNGTFLVSLDRLGQNGVLKGNSDFNRTSVSADVRRAFAQDLTVDVNAMYVNSSSARVQQGSNLSGILLGDYRTPPDFNNLPYLVNYQAPNGVITPGVQRTYRNPSGDPLNGGGYNNPFFSMYQDPTAIALNEVLGSAALHYNPAQWLGFTYRAGVNYYADRINTILAFWDVNAPDGQLIRNLNSNYQINSDLQGRATHAFSDNFKSTLLVGFHLDQLQYDNSGVVGTSFIIPTGPPTLTNDATFTTGDTKQIIRDAAMYAMLNLTFYNQLYLNLAGRDGSSSTYGPSAASLFFYPSVNAAWEFTKLPMFKDNDVLNFGKVRAGYGEAANQPPVYSTATTYLISPVIGNGWGTQIGTQYYYNNGVGGALINTVEGNANLGPERDTEFEYGFDLGLFNNFLQLSATGYHDLSYNVILAVPVAPSSGFTNIESNAVKMSNVGYELQATFNWLRVGDFSWQTIGNWSTNHNNIYSMPAGVTNITLSGFTDPSSNAILGQQMGVLYGYQWVRNSDGSIAIGSDGFPVGSKSTQGLIGDPNPNYIASVINTFRWQRFTLNFAFDFKIGGKVWNGTKGALSYFGTAGYQDWWTTISAQQATTLKNYDGLTVAQMAQGEDWASPNMPASAAYRKNSDGSYSFRGYVHNFGKGDVIVDETYFYDGPGSTFSGGPDEQFVEDGSYVSLRQLSLSYQVPLTAFGLQSLDLTLIGRNLALWTKYDGVDPGMNLTGPTNGQGIDYFNNPTIRSWIFSIQLNY